MVELIRYPTDADWYEVKRRALVTVGKTEFEPPTDEWKHKILEARHSPIRYLRFSFAIIDIPYWVACELRTHVHDMPYVADFGAYIKSQRNDRQKDYDRNSARQDAPVNMILDINGEMIQVLANKRLCNKATPEARSYVKEMCALVEDKCPEFKGLLMPMCVYHGGVCHEMQPCGKCIKIVAASVVHAKWINHSYNDNIQMCSNCGRLQVKTFIKTNFCWNCGAKMDLEEAQ